MADEKISRNQAYVLLNVDYKQVVFSILYGAILAKYKFNKYL